jgi:outer membrane lipoprotein carrier protein
MKTMQRTFAAVLLLGAAFAARADAVDTLREFVRDVKTGKAAFTQTVTSPDGAKKKSSSGSFEFARPNRFRFAYTQPYVQTIVADGQKVWVHDPDLNQVSSRKIDQALGTTPAALLTGGSLDKDFDLSAQPANGGLDWVQALPKAKEGSAFQSLRVGFKGKSLAAIEIVDSFGQRSRLDFAQLVANAALPADAFTFTVPKGADVIQQ